MSRGGRFIRALRKGEETGVVWHDGEMERPEVGELVVVRYRRGPHRGLMSECMYTGRGFLSRASRHNVRSEIMWARDPRGSVRVRDGAQEKRHVRMAARQSRRGPGRDAGLAPETERRLKEREEYWRMIAGMSGWMSGVERFARGRAAMMEVARAGLRAKRRQE